MNIALVLIHNKGTVGNAAQIAALKAMLTRETAIDPATGLPYSLPSYKVKGLAVSHSVRVYQIVPYGVARPANLNALVSHNVIYGAGDEDKTGDHPRFFNWGLKRGADYGADVVLHLEDVTKLSALTLAAKIGSDFSELSFGKLTSTRTLAQIGQVDESLPLATSISSYRQRIIQAGLISG